MADTTSILRGMMPTRPIAATMLLVSTLMPATAIADTYPRQPGVDAVHYMFRLTVGDETDAIEGETTATFRFIAQAVGEVFLDLAGPAQGKGMAVTGVMGAGGPLQYTHAADRLRIVLPEPPAAGEERSFTVRYHGVPASGLRIQDNIHGARTIFSESWPDRARQWLPTIDHPYDKATGEFIVTAPAHYQVVANGRLIEEIDLPGVRRRTSWKQSVPIASWLYAVGIARFAVHHYATVRGIPQQVWVFPEDAEQGYGLFELTGRQAFEYFSDWIGPYSYEKLAHVEAAGVSGGMEQASAIFYGEKNVAGGRVPVVHEVAHQWWGNAVTERDWDDVWLSEGFATYFAHLFTEHVNGRDAFVKAIKADIPVILKEQQELPGTPIVHRNLSDMTSVLNRLVYQKAGWTLHMLRGIVGTETFWAGIREYYRRFKDGNASTGDFRQVMEQVSGRPLSWFFDQWLTRAGIPVVAGGWRYDSAGRQVVLELSQTQTEDAFRLPIEVGLTMPDGQMRVERVELAERNSRLTLASEAAPVTVTLDPNTWVLMQAGPFVRREGQR
jgi:aminopeptidase N